MANIGERQTAADLWALPDVRGSYGGHLTWQKTPLAVELITADGVQLASGNDAADFLQVDLEAVNPLTMPYVNAFIAHTNQKVIKNWRTGKYRLAAIDKTKAMVVPITPVPIDDTDILSLLAKAPLPEPSSFHDLRSMAIVLYRASLEMEARERRAAKTVVPRAPAARPANRGKAVPARA